MPALPTRQGVHCQLWPDKQAVQHMSHSCCVAPFSASNTLLGVQEDLGGAAGGQEGEAVLLQQLLLDQAEREGAPGQPEPGAEG